MATADTVPADDLNAILGTRDVAIIVSKLKKYLSTSLVSGYDSQRLRREYCEKDYIRVLDAMYGEGRTPQMPWLESANGERFWEYHDLKRRESRQLRSWNRDKRKRAQAAYDLVQLLAVGSHKPTALSSFSTRKRFPYPVDMLPKTTVACIRRCTMDDLLLLLLNREMAETGSRTVLRETATSLLLSYTEVGLMYFLHYPVSRTRKGGSLSDTYSTTSAVPSTALPPSSSIFSQSATGSLSMVALPAASQPLPLLYRSVRSLKDRSPQRSAFWQYLLHYLPYETEGAPNQDSNLFLVAMAGFLLRMNSATLVPMPGQAPVTRTTPAGGVSRTAGGFSLRSGASTRGFGAAGITTDRYTTTVEYEAPTAEGTECVVLMLTYLFEDPLLRRCVAGATTAAPELAAFSPPAGSPSAVCLTPVLRTLHEPLFHFFRTHLERCSMEQSFGHFSRVVDSWLAYLTPWRSESRLKDRMYLPPHLEGTSAVVSRLAMTSRQPSRPASEWGDFESRRARGYGDWESYVALNYMFYVHLLGVFMKRVAKCDFSSNDSSVFDMLERCLDVFEPQVVDTLRMCSEIIDGMRPKRRHRSRSPPRRRTVVLSGSRARRLRSLLEQHHGMLQMPGHMEDTFASHQSTASTLIDRLRLGVMAAGQGARRTMHPNRHDRIFRRRGGAGWCDRTIEKLLRVWLDVSSLKRHVPKGPHHDRILAAASRVAGIMDLESKLTVELGEDGSGGHSPTSARALYGGSAPDRSIDGLLSSKGQQQLVSGQRMCDPLEVRFQGPEGAAPVNSHEIAWLVRLMQRYAVWVDCLFGSPSARSVDVRQRLQDIQQAEEQAAMWTGQRTQPGFMRLQARRAGPPKSYLRVLADRRFLLPLAVVYLYSLFVLVGWWSGLAIMLVCFVALRVLL